MRWDQFLSFWRYFWRWRSLRLLSRDRRQFYVLQQSDSRGPFPNTIFSSLVTAVSRAPEPISVYVENLDLSRFGGPAYEDSLKAHLHAKYDGKPIGVIAAIGVALAGIRNPCAQGFMARCPDCLHDDRRTELSPHDAFL